MNGSKARTIPLIVGLTVVLAIGIARWDILRKGASEAQSKAQPEVVQRLLEDKTDATLPSVAASGGGGGQGMRSNAQAMGSTTQPAVPAPTMEMIERNLNAQEFDQALALAEQLRAKLPPGKQRDELDLLRAQLLQAKGLNRDAIDALGELLSSSSDPEVLHQAASRYFILARNEGILEEAIHRQRQRLEAAPKDPSALRVMAQLYEYAGDSTNELRTRQALHAVHPVQENLARIAEIQRSMGLIDESSSTMSVLAENNPQARGHVLLRQAQMEIEAGRSDLAVQTAKQGLADPDMADSFRFRLAHLLREAGALDSALDAFNLLAANGKTQEARDRAELESCRIQSAKAGLSKLVVQTLTRLGSSETTYVRHEAQRLLGLESQSRGDAHE